MKILEAQVQISAMDRTGQAFDAVAAKAKALDAALKNQTASGGAPNGTPGSMSRQPTGEGYSLSGLGISIAAVGAAAISAEQAFAKLDRRITLLGITAEASTLQSGAMLKGAREVSMKYGTPTEGTIGAMEELATQGKHYDEIMGQIGPIIKASAVSGADPRDVARTSTALTDHFGIPISELPQAFDKLYAAGNAGKFELKDFARYLPMLAPMAAGRGLTGQEGLGKLASYLETIAGSAPDPSSAADWMLNILQKMDSDKTKKNFTDEEIGGRVVNIAEALDTARKDGGDQVGVLLSSLKQITEGDNSKINQIFQDLQALLGATALQKGEDKVKQYNAQLTGSAGSIDEQLPKVTNDAQAANTRLSNTIETWIAGLGESFWGLIGPGVMGGLRRSRQTPEAMRGVPVYTQGSPPDVARRQAALDAFYDKQITVLTERKAQYDANAQYYQGLTSKDGFLVRGFHAAAAENASQSSASVASEILNLLEQKSKARAEVAGQAAIGGKEGPAAPPPPIDVTGKVQLDPASKVAVSVQLKVDGASVTGMSATSGGNAKADVGVSMQLGHLSRRDE